MGSHLMHLVIANEMLPELSEIDEVGFLLGSLAPDATTEKGTSHYYAGCHEDLSRRFGLFTKDRVIKIYTLLATIGLMIPLSILIYLLLLANGISEA